MGRREFWRGRIAEGAEAELTVAKFERDGFGLITSLRESHGLIENAEDGRRFDNQSRQFRTLCPNSAFYPKTPARRRLRPGAQGRALKVLDVTGNHRLKYRRQQTSLRSQAGHNLSGR